MRHKERNKKLKEKLKQELIIIYHAPPPKNKRSFLRRIKPQPMNLAYILYTQVSYISKLEWVVSVCLFVATVFMSCFFEPAVFSVALAWMPFLAVVGVSESMRSVTYGMEELEMAARFSLKSIVLARMGIVGIENMVFVLLCAAFVQGKLLLTMLYLLVPYLATVYASLLITRKSPGREGKYLCVAFSMVVSITACFGLADYAWIYQERYNGVWVLSVMALVGFNYKESRRVAKMAECY